MEMTTRELKEMGRFFLKEYFGGIPEIHIEFKKPHHRNAVGLFDMEMNDEYCALADELYYEYTGYREIETQYGFAVGYNEDDLPWMDVINKPKVRILIAPELKKDRERLVMTLLHELCHYYCWYVGLFHHDDDRQFLDMCKKLGVPSNYDFEWVDKKWVYPERFRINVRNYIKEYEGRKCA